MPTHPLGVQTRIESSGSELPKQSLRASLLDWGRAVPESTTLPSQQNVAEPGTVSIEQGSSPPSAPSSQHHRPLRQGERDPQGLLNIRSSSSPPSAIAAAPAPMTRGAAPLSPWFQQLRCLNQAHPRIVWSESTKLSKGPARPPEAQVEAEQPLRQSASPGKLPRGWAQISPHRSSKSKACSRFLIAWLKSHHPFLSKSYFPLPHCLRISILKLAKYSSQNGEA